MDLHTALWMEAEELEKMKRNASTRSSSNGTTAARTGTSNNSTGTSSSAQHQADLISFLESPPAVTNNQWSFFEQQNTSRAATLSGGRSRSAKDFTHSHLLPVTQQTMWSPTRSGSLTLQSSPLGGMKRTGSESTFMGPQYSSNFPDYHQSAGLLLQRQQQQQIFYPPGGVHRQNNFTPVPLPVPFAPHSAVTGPQVSFKSSTPPAISTPTPFSLQPMESTMQEQSLNKSWDTATFATESKEKKDGAKSQADEMNDVFQRWLDDSYNNFGGETFNDNSPLIGSNSPTSPTAHWKEWDPLLVVAEPVYAVVQKPKSPKIKEEKTVEDSTKEDSVTDSSESPVLKNTLGNTAKEQFIDSVVEIHSTFLCNDPLSNPGYFISPMMPRWQNTGNDGKDSSTVKVSITTEESNEPVVFTCNIIAAVEHVVSQALCIAHEDISQITTSDYRFRVQGRQEFLLSGTTLNLYEYVQDCIKLDEDVRLQLVHRDAMDRSLIRTDSDPSGETLREELTKSMKGKATWDQISIVKDAFFTETEKLQKHTVTSNLTQSQQCDCVHQAVKAVIQVLGSVETLEVSHAMLKLRQAVERDWSSGRQDVFNPDGSTVTKPTSAIVMSSDSSMTKQDHIDRAIEALTVVICSFIDMYCKAMALESSHPSEIPTTISSNVQDLVTLNVISVHRLPNPWSSMYEEYYVSCRLLHGNQDLRHIMNTKTVKSNKHYHGRIAWDVWLTFSIKVSELPRETKLCLTLHGYLPGKDVSKPEKIVSKEVAWVNVPLFDHNNILHHGSSLYGMWWSSNVTTQEKLSAMCSSNIAMNDNPAICIQLLSSQQNKGIMFPPYSVRFELPRNGPNGPSMSSLDESTQQDLAKILSKNPMTKLADHEQDLLWKHRHIKEYVQSCGSLARILRSVPSWAPRNLPTVYQLLETWPSIEPIEAFELLSVSFPDVFVRKFAIQCIQQAEEDEIHDYLVQLTQALKYEMFHDSMLSQFLLRAALGSLRIAHKLFWLLSENVEIAYSSERYKTMLLALEVAGGSKLKKEFEKETYLVKMVNRVAEAVKYAKDSLRMTVLKSELDKVANRVKKHSFRLPTYPALVSNGIDVVNSSYFTSNAIPLRLAFDNVEANPKHFQLMFKVGDDLRQDVLTMQLVTIMDKLWLAEGLDLKMVTFSCLSTGKDRGFIELVSDSITLREIQSSYGLTGAFKDRPIAEWLQKHNPTAISYEKAEENFTLSCAGYCVATYVLGICDRHNDNIMLRQSGHLFHIDFARFLGHAQMFGNIKRDRAPFVLTSDMAYVINGGDRPSSRFHDFVDICCRAFNIIRNNSHIFINLLSLMIHSGIPELKSISDLKYVYDALKPAASETEATAMFTRLIEASLSSSFTRLNFFIHNLAQLRFSGNENENKKSLSFCSKTHTADEDGILTDAVVVGYNKRYSPEKYYVFCIRLKRDMRSGESYVYRTFSEFAELHHKLSLNFPSWKLPSFPSKVIVGRSQVKQVAERRKVQLNGYLRALLHDRLAVSKSDLIYTFFHPMLRDEHAGKTKTPTTRTVTGSVSGEIKLSVHHKNNALFIMVMHCRNLISPDGNDPDPYVKTYLLPDQSRSTKRKTKVARKTLHPTYNEMIIYNVPLSDVGNHQLYISVWNYEQLNENDFLGSVTLQLDKMDLAKDNTAWYPLTTRLLSTYR